MKRLDLLLAGVLMVCALSVVMARHQARLLFIDLESLKKEARELEVEWNRLQLEQGTLISHARVESLARHELGLVSPPLDRVWLIDSEERP